ncbi:MAG: hypothetical protein L0H53_07070 [Candidatus Nitrosocosmicus sp.]|nr:hypothetical protein [Candidatus Nitrosocosmicus sp.]
MERDITDKTCLNKCYITFKLLIYNANIVQVAENEGTIGITFKDMRIDFYKIANRVNRITDEVFSKIKKDLPYSEIPIFHTQERRFR